MNERPPAGRNRFLSALRPPLLDRLQPHLQDVVLRRGAKLSEAGVTQDFLYFPAGALVSVLAVTAAGETVETTSIGNDGGVGALAALSSAPAMDRAVVRIGGEALRLPAHHFRNALQESRELQSLVLQGSAIQTAQIQNCVACMVLHDLPARISRWLLEAADRTGQPVLPVTQEVVAGALGVHRATVNAVLRKLERDGLTRSGTRGRFELANREGLALAACGCYAINARRTEHFLSAVGGG